jgi:hypothetical protein
VIQKAAIQTGRDPEEQNAVQRVERDPERQNAFRGAERVPDESDHRLSDAIRKSDHRPQDAIRTRSGHGQRPRKKSTILIFQNFDLGRFQAIF